jgi:hypothetical protein
MNDPSRRGSGLRGPGENLDCNEKPAFQTNPSQPKNRDQLSSLGKEKSMDQWPHRQVLRSLLR